MTIFVILILNDNDDDVKTLCNIYNRIANVNLWLLIPPSLGLNQWLFTIIVPAFSSEWCQIEFLLFQFLLNLFSVQK